jgi:hypothetical protein
MGIITNTLNECVITDFKHDNLYDNQIITAIDIIKKFDSNEPKTNYVIVKGLTQSGKTGIFFSIINIISKLKMEKSLGIDKILFITADNSKDLIKQQQERAKQSLFSDISIPIYYLKRSDLKPSKIQTIDNSVIFIDESHFGTTKETNILPQFLKHYGIDYLKNNMDLYKHNIRIISNSATPYQEINSDKVACKLYSFFQPSPNYIGLTDFYNNGLIIKKEPRISKERKNDYKNVLIDSYNHLQALEKKYGVKKCMLFRLNNSKDLSVIKGLAINKFNIFEFDTKNINALNYENLWNAILAYDIKYKHEPKKYHLIIIKNALRMGITIPIDIKEKIGVVYDVAASQELPTTTEQGLCGRLTGYYNNQTWLNFKLYLNKRHVESLIHYYENLNINNPQNNKIYKIKDSIIYKEVENIDESNMFFDEDIKNDDNYNNFILNNKVYTTHPINNISQHIYSVYNFLKSKEGTDFCGLKNFNINDLRKKNIAIVDIIKECLISIDEYYKINIENGVLINKGCRRSISSDTWATSFKSDILDSSKPLLISKTTYPPKKTDYNKIAFQALLNIDGLSDEIPHIEIILKRAEIKYHLIQQIQEETVIKTTAPTMITE